MSENSKPSSPVRMGRATIAALIVAALVLAFVIGSGDEAEPPADAPRAAEAPAAAPPVDEGEPSPEDELAALISGNIRDAEPGTQKAYDTPFKTEVIEVPLASLEEVELKAHMEPGDTYVYSWTAPHPVYVDMHGEPYTYPDEPAIRYEERDGVASGHGRITATVPGMHGWFWLNTGEEDAVIEVRISGYYEKVEEVYRSGPE